MVKVIIIGLIFVALLSIIRAIFFHHEIKTSMIDDLKSEAKILGEYVLSTKQLPLNFNRDVTSFQKLQESTPNQKVYVKYVVVNSHNKENQADAEELKLFDYFLRNKDQKEYFHEYDYKGEVSYQYALPIYLDSNSSLSERTLSVNGPQAMISVRMSNHRGFKNLYGIILKEIFFSLLIIVVMILLLLFLYRNTKKRMSEIDNEANKYAFSDALTGLYNRHYLNHFLEKFTPIQNTEKCFAVLFIDIDDFKNVNDQYGHIVGDCVLKELGQKLQSLTRQEDLLCRYGGEEFLIIISDITKKFVMEKAEHIRISVDEMEFSCQKKKATISIGLSCGKRYDDINKVIEQADKALYRAKTSGKNCIEIF